MTRTFFIEYDRTRRVDKNFEKFRRYDTFLCWWRLFTDDYRDGEAPIVFFVCQDPEHRDLFLEAADHELTGRHWHPHEAPNSRRYIGRRNVLFVLESEMHAGSARAMRVPAFPPGHPRREHLFRRVRLPGQRAD